MRAPVVLGSVTSWLQHQHGTLLYAAVGFLVFFELGIVIGFFIPGEVASVLGGVVAADHRANVFLMAVVVVAAAIVGNFSGYRVGLFVGPWLLDHRPLKGNMYVRRAEHLIARWGGPAVFLGRFVVVVRAVLPGLAGISSLRLRTFAMWTVIGGVVWGTLWVSVGYVAGASFNKVLHASTVWGGIALGVVAAAAVAWWTFRRRRERAARRALSAGDEPGPI